MTRHLSADTLADLAEGGGAHPHLAACERCSTRLRDAREALAEARQLDVPEPSPLFWEHLSGRVRESVEKDARPAGLDSAWSVAVWLPLAAGVLIACAVAAGLFVPRSGKPETLPSTAAQPASARAQRGAPGADVQASTAEMLAPANDPSWGLIAHVAQAIEFEDSVLVQPGATDRAVAHLSPEEQQEFMRLLQSELNAPPSQ